MAVANSTSPAATALIDRLAASSGADRNSARQELIKSLGGIPIGRVRTIDDRGAALFSYAQVTPAVDFARIDEVLLLLGGAVRDVASSFKGDG